MVVSAPLRTLTSARARGSERLPAASAPAGRARGARASLSTVKRMTSGAYTTMM